MDVNPNMAWLRDELRKAGIDYEIDDSEDETYEGFTIHVERTSFVANGEETFVVTYGWSRDADWEKRGLSVGYPAYLECVVGDGRPLMVSVGDIMERIRG